MSASDRLAIRACDVAKSPAGAVGQDVAAAELVVRFLLDLAAGKATIAEGLATGLALDKALAISLAKALVALYETFPPGWDVIKITPFRPLGKDGVNPESGAAVFT